MSPGKGIHDLGKGKGQYLKAEGATLTLDLMHNDQSEYGRWSGDCEKDCLKLTHNGTSVVI